MALDNREAIRRLAKILEGEFPAGSFQFKAIGASVFRMSGANFGHKLDRPLTRDDHYRIVQFFDLPDEVVEAFQQPDIESFDAVMQRLEIGIFSKNPSDQLSQKLFSLAEQSKSTLSFVRLRQVHRGGPIGPDNLVESHDPVLYTGDKGHIEYKADGVDVGWFALVNVHLATGSTRLINPVYKESLIPLQSAFMRYPESSTLNFEKSDLLGAHTLFAFIMTESMKDALLAESSRLLRAHNSSESRDTANHFDGVLDPGAMRNLVRAGSNGIVDAARFRYRQAAPNHNS